MPPLGRAYFTGLGHGLPNSVDVRNEGDSILGEMNLMLHETKHLYTVNIVS